MKAQRLTEIIEIRLRKLRFDLICRLNHKILQEDLQNVTGISYLCQ